MNTFDITASYMGEDFTILLDSSTCTEESVLEQLKDAKKERFEQESGEDMEDADLEETFEVSDWQEVPTWAQDWDILEELMPEYENSHNDLEVFEAAHELGISFDSVDEAYNGEWGSDEDFARETAEQLGAIDNNLSWPYTCIDWEFAARELMYDYSASNNHYFRNL